MHVTSDVIIGVAGGLLMIALCVVAIVIFRSLYTARRKRSDDRHTQGACHCHNATAMNRHQYFSTFGEISYSPASRRKFR